MKNITERWKKLKTGQKIIYILFSLWLIDLFLGLSKKGKIIFIGCILLFGLFGSFQEQNIDNTLEIEKKKYTYTFIEENKQLTGNCTRSEWVYSVPDNIQKEDLEPILQEIYQEREKQANRTNISLYTENGLQKISKGETSISIAFLNDGFNCDTPREVKIIDNYDIYQTTKDL